MLEAFDEQHAVGEARQIVVPGVVPELAFEPPELREGLAQPVHLELDEGYVFAREAVQLVDRIAHEHPAFEAGGVNDRGGDRLPDALRPKPLLHLRARRLRQMHALAKARDCIPHGIARWIDRARAGDWPARLQACSQGGRRLLVREQHELGLPRAEHVLGVSKQSGDRVLGVRRLADRARGAPELLALLTAATLTPVGAVGDRQHDGRGDQKESRSRVSPDDHHPGYAQRHVGQRGAHREHHHPPQLAELEAALGQVDRQLHQQSSEDR